MVPLFSPQRQNEAFLAQLNEAISAVIHSGQFILGSEPSEFEKNLARELGYGFAVATASSNIALVIGIKALNLPPGSEIIVPAFAFISSASAVVLAGHIPVFADVTLESSLLQTENILHALTPQTRAVLLVDLHGRQPEVARIKEFCRAHDLNLIEDGAQSIGVPNRGADFFTTSFYPTKNVGALGNAGAVLTDNPDLALKIRELTRHGSLARDRYRYVGTDARLDAMQAAVLNLKLRQLKRWNEQRRQIADRYLAVFRRNRPGYILPPPEPTERGEHVWNLFTLRVLRQRSAIAEYMSGRRVGTGIYYPRALTQQPALEKFVTERCPNSERLATEVLSIPLYPELSESEISLIEKTLDECLKKNLT